jgi:hypothetical protein
MEKVQNCCNANLQVVSAVLLKIEDFRDVTPFRWGKIFHRSIFSVK